MIKGPLWVGQEFVDAKYGTMRARILEIVDSKTVIMIRSDSSGGRLKHRFELPVKFMRSKGCGWREETNLNV